MIRTARLILRPWRDDDVEPFAALNADPIVMEHFPAPLDRVGTIASVEWIRAHFDRHGYGLWAVEAPGVAPFIGFTGLARPTFRPDDVEIGWRLAREHWGAGYATEAARAALAHGFETLGLDEVISMTVPANTRSQRVMVKLGLQRDPSANFDHPKLPVGHPLRPHWLYRLRNG